MSFFNGFFTKIPTASLFGSLTKAVPYAAVAAVCAGVHTGMGSALKEEIIELSWGDEGIKTRDRLNQLLDKASLQVGFLGASRRGMIEGLIERTEGYQFVKNEENACFYRGEILLGEEESPETIQKRMDKLMEEGRQAPLIPMRPKAAGYNFLELLSVGNPILAIHQSVLPPRWTSGVVALSTDLKMALGYSSPILTISLPQKIFSIAGVDHKNLDGKNDAREFEVITPAILPSDMIICAHYDDKEKKIKSVIFDLERISAHGPLVIDQQMLKFMEMLDPLDPKQKELLDFLKTQTIQPERDFSKEYIEKEAANIYENYYRTACHLLDLYNSYVSTVEKSRREGFAGEAMPTASSVLSVEDFFIARMPTLASTFESVERSSVGLNLTELDKLRERLEEAGLPSSVTDRCLKTGPTPFEKTEQQSRLFSDFSSSGINPPLASKKDDIRALSKP